MFESEVFLQEIGVISDTHGLFREEIAPALAGVGQILHLGDIGPPEILDRLREIAPLTVVRGNVDIEAWTQRIPPTATVQIGGLRLYLIHDLGQLRIDPAQAGYHAVLYGHSHQPKEERKDGVLYLNPGSAGPRRFKLPITLARMTIDAGEMKVKFIDLETGT